MVASVGIPRFTEPTDNGRVIVRQVSARTDAHVSRLRRPRRQPDPALGLPPLNGLNLSRGSASGWAHPGQVGGRHLGRRIALKVTEGHAHSLVTAGFMTPLSSWGLPASIPVFRKCSMGDGQGPWPWFLASWWVATMIQRHVRFPRRIFLLPLGEAERNDDSKLAVAGWQDDFWFIALFVHRLELAGLQCLGTPVGCGRFPMHRSRSRSRSYPVLNRRESLGR